MDYPQRVQEEAKKKVFGKIFCEEGGMRSRLEGVTFKKFSDEDNIMLMSRF